MYRKNVLIFTISLFLNLYQVCLLKTEIYFYRILIKEIYFLIISSRDGLFTHQVNRIIDFLDVFLIIKKNWKRRMMKTERFTHRKLYQWILSFLMFMIYIFYKKSWFNQQITKDNFRWIMYLICKWGNRFTNIPLVL